jgi:hypothetical protein
MRNIEQSFREDCSAVKCRKEEQKRCEGEGFVFLRY